MPAGSVGTQIRTLVDLDQVGQWLYIPMYIHHVIWFPWIQFHWCDTNISNQIETLVDGLIEGAAESFNFTENSFLPDQALDAINEFVNASVQNINITGTHL